MTVIYEFSSLVPSKQNFLAKISGRTIPFPRNIILKGRDLSTSIVGINGVMK